MVANSSNPPFLDISSDRPLVQVLDVFSAGPGGGNPAPVVVDATGMSDEDMQQIAQDYGLESGFVLPAPEGSGCDFALRFWVPNHEMEMCGHATVASVWILNELGLLPRRNVSIWTASGRVEARVVESPGGGIQVEVAQGLGQIQDIRDVGVVQEILGALGIDEQDLTSVPIQNAATSRIKTLVPIRSVERLDSLAPDPRQVEEICGRIGSTGLYPYAVFDPERNVVDARQFPRSSGYLEDPATGIAATALAFGLLGNGVIDDSSRPLTIRQGRAMGRPSQISVRFDTDSAGQPTGCWMYGPVQLAASGARA